jgi:predicted nucleotidyltransferase
MKLCAGVKTAVKAGEADPWQAMAKSLAHNVNLSNGWPNSMKPSQALAAHRADIRRIVSMNRAENPRVFGSVLRGDDTDASDLDLLVDTTAQTSLLDIARIQHTLRRVLGVPVDVLTPKALPEKFRAAVVAQAQPV